MIIGIPKEIKQHEYRVALTPAGVKELKSERHKIILEKGAGEGSPLRSALNTYKGRITHKALTI